jgi:hypothetical protein
MVVYLTRSASSSKNVRTESDSVTNTRKADRPHYSRRRSSSFRGVVVGIAFAADPERADVERDAATLMRPGGRKGLRGYADLAGGRATTFSSAGGGSSSLTGSIIGRPSCVNM